MIRIHSTRAMVQPNLGSFVLAQFTVVGFRAQGAPKGFLPNNFTYRANGKAIVFGKLREAGSCLKCRQDRAVSQCHCSAPAPHR